MSWSPTDRAENQTRASGIKARRVYYCTTEATTFEKCIVYLYLLTRGANVNDFGFSHVKGHLRLLGQRINLTEEIG